MDDPAGQNDGEQVAQEQIVRPQFSSTFSITAKPSYTFTPSQPSYLVDSIRFNGDLVSQEILTRLPSVSSHQKLVVSFGELHENGAHIVLENDVVHKMVVNGVKCAFGLEWPPNNIDLHIDDTMTLETTDKPGLKSFLRKPRNQHLREKLSADTTPVRTSNARLSRSVLHQYIDNHQIPIFCSDAERDWDVFVDGGRSEQTLLTTDSKTLRAVQEAALILKQQHPDGLQGVNALHQLGMLARNLYMLHDVEEIAAEYPDIDVIFLQAGRAHVAGNQSLLPEPSLYQHGLSQLFANRKDFAFIGVPLFASEADREANTPPEASGDPSLLKLQILPNTPFNVVSSNVSDRTEAQQIVMLSPYFECIDETLQGRDARELWQERKRELMTRLEGIRDDNHLIPLPEATPH